MPRLPRGRGLRLSRPELFRIAGLAILLAFLIVTQRRCASAVSTFVTGFGDRGSGTAAMPRPGAVDAPGAVPGSDAAAVAPGPTTAATRAGSAGPSAGSAGRGRLGAGAPGGPAAGEPAIDRYEHLRPGMSDAEIKAVIDRARARATTGKTGP